MLTNEEKIVFLLRKLPNLDLIIQDLIDGGEIEGKRPIAEYIELYQAEKDVVIQTLRELGHEI